MHSCLYLGRVEHRRLAPCQHRFSYPLFMVWLDLDELDSVFRKRWLWSVKRPAPARFRRCDHLGDPGLPLKQCVQDLVEQRTGLRPGGPIRLLTQLSYFGYCFNPVSFYYCYDDNGERLQTLLAEVSNTPWGERHCYVLALQDAERERHIYRIRLRKRFHVSPFMPMDIDYDWRFSEPAQRLYLHLQNRQAGNKLFDATLNLRQQPMTGLSLARVLAVYPLMTMQLVGAIYYQAFRLWLKRTPFYSHPDRVEAPDPADIS